MKWNIQCDTYIEEEEENKWEQTYAYGLIV